LARKVVERLRDGLYILRLDDDQTEYFEALWSIPEGVTYNAYVLVGNAGAVVFDTWKSSYCSDFIEALKSVVELDRVRYIVVHHAEPDHSGCLRELLEACEFRPRVLGHPIAEQILRSMYGLEKMVFEPVKDGEERDLCGFRAKFVYIPWLHWPDTIATYLADYGALLTCDAFGGFGIPPTISDSDSGWVDEYYKYVRKYVATVVGHYREFIARNIEKIEKLGLKISMIAPAHGLVWSRNPMHIVELYRELAEAKPRGNKVLMVYSSMYGFVKRVMNLVRDLIEHRGVEVVEYAFTDSNHPEWSDIVSDALDARALILGFSAYEASVHPLMKTVLSLLVSKVDAPKPLLVVYVYGWGPTEAKDVKELLDRSRFRVVDYVPVQGSKLDVERLERAVNELLKQ